MKAQASGRAFTLTELLVVMSVVIILMSMLVVGIDGIFTYAVRMQCQHHMEQTWQACMMYQNQNKLLPYAWDVDGKKPWYVMLKDEEYVRDEYVLGCPASDMVDEYGSLSWGGGGAVGGAAPEALVDTLRWLALKQNAANGNWPGGGSGNDATRTALCILSFIGAGVVDDDPEFGSTVARGVEWLAANHSDGYFGLNNYTQGMCLMALADASVFLKDETLRATAKAAAQKALDYLLNHQLPGWDAQRNVNDNSDGGFTYSSGGHDMSVSGWCYQGIAEAIRANLVFNIKTSPTDLERIYGQPPGPGARVGWMVRVVLDDGSSRYTDDVTSGYIGNLSGNPQRLTQAALAARLLLGPPGNATRVKWEQFNYYQAYYILDNSRTNRSAGFTEKDPSQYSHIQNIQGGDQLYALYYSTVAMFKAGDKPAWDTGGASINYWSDWRAAYIQVLLDTGDTKHGNGIIKCSEVGCHTHPEGKSMSHWPITADVSHGAAFGEIVTTALAALSLGVDVGQHDPDSKWSKFEAGKHSFGYNIEISFGEENARRTPASDTIILMDYMLSAIQGTDSLDKIAARHGGRVNVFFADGHVRAMTIDELRDPGNDTRIDPRMLSVKPAAEPLPDRKTAPDVQE